MRSQIALYTLFMDYCSGRVSRRQVRHILGKLRRQCDIKRFVFFTMDLEPWSPAPEYKALLKWTPYILRKNKYRLKEDNDEYWQKADEFVMLAKKSKSLAIPNLFPSRYVNTLYDRSDLDLDGYAHHPIWSPAALDSQQKYLARWMAILRKHYKKPWVSLSNEAQHNSHGEGYDIAMRHRVWKVATGLPLENVMLDGSHSEFVYAELVDPHDVFGKTCGCDIYARNKHHHVICEHGVSLEEQVSRIVAIYDASRWKRRTHSVFSSDGATWGQGEEYVLHRGLPQGKGYRNTNESELYRKAYAVWHYSKAYIVEEFPMEMWERTEGDHNNAVANYSLLDYGRLKALKRAKRDLKKTGAKNDSGHGGKFINSN